MAGASGSNSLKLNRGLEPITADDFHNVEQVCKKIHPSKFLKDHLQLGVRPSDNRKHFSYRGILGNIDIVENCCGSSLVKIGNTTVVCGISNEPTSPSKKYHNKGLVDINCKLSEHCNVHHNYRNKVVQLRQCVYLLQKLFIGLKVIDLDSLCIAKGELVWLLRIHIVCIDYDGGFWDAAVMAMYLALKSVKLPEMYYDGDLKRFLLKVDIKKPIPIGPFPLATTFAVFQKFVFADPTREEEELCSSFIVVVVENDEIKIVQKRGGTTITEDQLNQCIEVAKSRYKVTIDVVDGILKQTKPRPANPKAS